MRARRPEVFAATLVFAGLWLGPAQAEAPKFDTDIQPIFDANCVACHQTGAAQQGLILESGISYDALVGRDSRQSKLHLVEPGDPQTSYLLTKITGTQALVGGKGARMPLGGELDAASIELIRSWILAGAKLN